MRLESPEGRGGCFGARFKKCEGWFELVRDPGGHVFGSLLTTARIGWGMKSQKGFVKYVTFLAPQPKSREKD